MTLHPDNQTETTALNCRRVAPFRQPETPASPVDGDNVTAAFRRTVFRYDSWNAGRRTGPNFETIGATLNHPEAFDCRANPSCFYGWSVSVSRVISQQRDGLSGEFFSFRWNILLRKRIVTSSRIPV